MAIIRTFLTLAANDESDDNLRLSPVGGDVYLQLNRGANCVISQYRLDICTWTAGGELQIEKTLVPSGQYPSGHDPNAGAPLHPIGPPAALTNRCVVLVTDGVALPPNAAGAIDVIVGVFQQTAGNYRRVDWKADTAHAVQLQSRFEIIIQP